MRRLILILVVIGTTITSMAQNVEDKLSSSTMMFLSELRGEITLPKADDSSQANMKKANARTNSTEDKTSRFVRPIVEPEYVNGIQMISAFLTVSDGDYSKAQTLGVIISEKFGNVATALIPTDKIMEVAALPNVTNIEVGEIMQTHNDQQRTLTRAYDAITNSSAAQALGITSPYTGKGVIVGIIDQGIDFQHLAFKDKNGKSRIIRALTLKAGSNVNYDVHSTEEAINNLTYDTNNADHGTHTSAIAAGSSVIVNGNDVTVTDDHANATYGGMAPEADLVIIGLRTIYTTNMANSIKQICAFADRQNKPCVINLSIGSLEGPHDGTGPLASALADCVGDNHIIVFSAGNDGMRANKYVKLGTSNGGGCYATGTSTLSKPMMANIQRSYEDADGNVTLDAPTILAYARTPNVATSLKFHVVDTSTGAVVYSSNAYTTTSGQTIDITGSTGLAQYFKSTTSDANHHGEKGKIYILSKQNSTNKKYYWEIYAPVMRSTSFTTANGIKKGKYAFCISIYPASGSQSSIIDLWETAEHGCWFGNDLTLNSSAYNLVNGSDDCSVSNNACYPNVISCGAYTSKNVTTDYTGNTNDFTDLFPNIGDHSYFSGWQTAESPLGVALPTIMAPAARVVSAVNHYHTTTVDNASFYNANKKENLMVNNQNYPYGFMGGTSMSAPCVSGIIALWMQACLEKGITPTPDYMKEVMQNTWITDEWTNGTAEGAHGAKTFGTHGKINAIAGLRYILGLPETPIIAASPTTLNFETTVGNSEELTFNVASAYVRDKITATLSDESGVFTVSPTTITPAEAKEGKTITVTFSPTAIGTYTGTITLASDGAESVNVNLNATATKAYPNYFDVAISSMGLSTLYLDFPVEIPYETEPDLLGVYYIIGINGKELRAARLNKDIPANTGVIVQGNSGTYRFYKTDSPTPLKYPSLLSGSIEDITQAQALEQAQKSGTIYTLGRGTDSYINFYPYAEPTLHANKAFFIYEDENNAKRFTLSFSGDATGINQIDNDRNDGAWYTIQGIRLNGKPNQKGIYIYNGNTHIIK